MGLRSRIFIGFSLVVLLVLGFSGYTIWNVQQSNKVVGKLHEENIPMLLAKERMAFNVAERLALARGYVLLGDKRYKQEFDELTKESEELSAWITENTTDDEILYITKVNKEWTEVINKEIFPAYDNGDQDQAKLVLLGKGTSNARLMMRLFRTEGDQDREEISVHLSQVEHSGHSLLNMTLLIAGIVVLLSIIIAVFLSRSILQPLKQLVSPVKLIASGDLTGEEVKAKTKDELGQLTVAFNEMRENLRSLIGKTASMSSQVAATAEQLSASSEETSAATNQVAVTMQEVSNTSEGTLSRSKESSTAAQQVYEGVEKITFATASASEKAEEVAKHSTEGEQAILRAVQQIGTIQQSTKESAALIAQLGERSREIGDILNLITSISEQTNLLALNAAIEAARAGEHGKGFAVVADEVRKLAEESGESAAKISEMIKAIQTETEKAGAEMNRGTKEVEIGTNVVHEVGQSFASISSSIEQMTEEMLNVSKATQKISKNTIDLSESLSEMEQSSISNAEHSKEVTASTEEQLAAIEEIASSAEQLNHLASELQDEVKKFKL